MSSKNTNEFENYAKKHIGISSLAMHDYKKKLILPKSMTPYIMEERQLNVSQVDVFSRLMMDRIIWILGEITDVSAAIIQAQLMYLESVDNKKDIHIHVDSEGGSVVAGLKLIDIMNYVNCDIATINTGMAASMGAVILAAGKNGKRQSLKHSKTMIHMSSGGAVGNIQDARIMMELWEGYNGELFRLLGEYCGKPEKQVMKDAERDKWLSAEEAKEYNLIDSIVTPKKRK